MRKTLFALGVLIALAGCGKTQAQGASFQSGAASAQSPAQEEAPGRASAQRPVQDPFSWDFGKVTTVGKMEHVFTLANNSQKTLKLTGTSTSCGCTASSLEKTTLAPGESAPVKVTFNPKGYNGPVTQFAYVTTDDPENPVYKFSIHALVTQ